MKWFMLIFVPSLTFAASDFSKLNPNSRNYCEAVSEFSDAVHDAQNWSGIVTDFEGNIKPAFDDIRTNKALLNLLVQRDKGLFIKSRLDEYASESDFERSSTASESVVESAEYLKSSTEKMKNAMSALKQIYEEKMGPRYDLVSYAGLNVNQHPLDSVCSRK